MIDFDDDLPAFGGAPIAKAPVELSWFQAPQAEPRKFPCGKCGGTGTWRSFSGRSSGPCHACKGKGFFLSSDQDRAKARKSSADRKARNVAELRQAFDEANPGVSAFLVAASSWRNPSDFLGAMRNALDTFGFLTENQLAAVQRTMAKIEAGKAQRQDAKKPVDMTGIERAFAAAAASGKKRLSLHLGDFVFSPAAAGGANAGKIWVKTGDVFLGGIKGGVFSPTREGVPLAAKVAEEAGSITDFESIKVRGQQTGTCCCCGAELTDPVSIEAGIGPICAEKWGF